MTRTLRLFILSIYFSLSILSANAQSDTLKIDFHRIIKADSGFFGPPARFNEDIGNFCLQKGIWSNVRVDIDEYQQTLPSFSLGYETGISEKFGLMFNFGHSRWKDNAYNYTYTYYTGSVRGLFHFNLHRNIDLYSGIALTGRFLNFKSVTDKSDREIEEWNRLASINGVLGMRYFLSPKFAAVLEYGNDLTSFLSVGVLYQINKSEDEK